MAPEGHGSHILSIETITLAGDPIPLLTVSLVFYTLFADKAGALALLHS